MIEEIRDTARCLQEALDVPAQTFTRDLGASLSSTKTNRLYAIGCGTSFHAAAYARYAFQKLAGLDVHPLSSFDLLQYPPSGLAADAGVIAFSHSGKTKCTIDSLILAAKSAGFVLSVTNIPGTPLCTAATHSLIVPGGADRVYAKTKSFTTMLMMNLLLALEWGSFSRFLRPEKRLHWEGLLAGIPDKVGSAVGTLDEHLATLAKSCQDTRNWLFVGSGPNQVVAVETALKMKEANYSVAEGFESEEVVHGRLQPVDSSSVVVCFESGGPADRRCLDVVLAARMAAARVVVVTNDPRSAMSSVADDVIQVPNTGDELLSSLVNVVPGQLLAYHLAVVRGLNPDLIRNDDPRYAAMSRIVFPPGTH